MYLPNLSLGTELTFIPVKGRRKEFKRLKDAEFVARALSGVLEGLDSTRGRFRVKADVFRSWPQSAWIIEVNSIGLGTNELCLHTLTCVTYWDKALAILYSEAAKLGLYPGWESTRKGVTKHYPTAGGHIHVGIDWWYDDATYLIKLAIFERSLCLHYASNPQIRWLFAQWFDDLNSHTALNHVSVSDLHTYRRTSDPSNIDATAYARALDCQSIKQRFARTGKAHYPTYELRFFDMARTVEEFKLQADFVRHWFGYHIGLAQDALTFSQNATPIHFTLTPARWRRLSTKKGLIRATERLFDELELDFAKYQCFVERNLINRLRYGKLI